MQALGNLAMSFLCGPFIMLQLGWNNEDGVVSVQSAMISALVAFGWSFLTGLLIVGIYVGLRY